MKLLHVDDDQETLDHVVHVFQQQGYEVETANCGTDGLERARSGMHSALLLDRRLPDLDGISVVRQLRSEGNRIPILLLTTMSGLDDRVNGLEDGADDYLVKPASTSELIARVSAIMRRAEREADNVTRFRVADLEIDVIRRTAVRDGTPIALLEQEFKVLEFLMRHAGRYVTRTMLLEQVWDLHFDPRTSIVETHISRLRSKIERGYSVKLIHFTRGVGYTLRPDISLLQGAALVVNGPSHEEPQVTVSR